MIDEYDRINSNSNGTKTSRLRLFLFPSKSDTMSSIGSLLESSTKSEDWFLNALNGATSTSTKVLSESSSVNCLLGLDDDIGNGNSTGKDAEPLPDGSVNIKNGGVNHAKVNAQDVHSVPDSPMLAMTSSFDSTSSSPPLGNLPPIRVRVEDNHRVGIEEHFSQMTIGAGAGAKVEQKQEEGGFAALTSPPAPPVAVGGEYPSRVYSDDERSEHGVPVGYSKPPLQQQPSQQPPQMQPKPPTPTDLPSPGSVSSEGSASNPLSRPKQYIYQDPMMQIQPGVRVSANPVDPMISDPNSRAQVQQQVQDSVYFVQQPTPTQTYNLPVQQTSEPSPTASTRPQTPPPTTVVPPTSDYNTPRNVPASKPEMNAGSYRTAVAPQLVQVAPGQHLPQYAGFTQIHHPSQSTVPTSAATGNYAYAFTDPTHAQIYYTQPFAPQLSAQYQTMKSVHGIPEASSQLPTENLNQHA
nr:RNA polymerase II degradation factor 1 [Ipomoea batatas]